MELNSIIFPAPQPTYDFEDFPGELMWIPRLKHTQNIAIPCLFLQSFRPSPKLLLYFHGNAEDLCITYDILDHLRNTLNVHVLGVEYPGYGAYAGSPNAQALQNDAEDIFLYCLEVFEIHPKNIILLGRSIGSGPATWLARHYLPGALGLISPFTSLRAVVNRIVGKVAGYLVANRFKNSKLIKDVYCPTFILHGQADTLIPYQQSQKLQDNCPATCTLIMPELMDHNDFEYSLDLTQPFLDFMNQCGMTNVVTEEFPDIFQKITQGLFTPPPGQPRNLTQGKMNKFLQRYS